MKKGLFTLSDIAWFTVFVIAAMLIYVFLFRPFEAHTNNKIVTENVGNDATFIALSLPRLKAETYYALDPPVFVTGRTVGDTKTFSDAIRAVVEARNLVGDDKIAETGEYRQYTHVLRDTVGNSAFWTAQNVEKNRPVRVAVILKEDKLLKSTCVEFSREGTPQLLCARLFTETNTFVGAKVGTMEFSGADSQTGQTVRLIDNTEVGTAYIPNIPKPITLHVYIEYEDSDE
jgi:hypothetical protein